MCRPELEAGALRERGGEEGNDGEHDSRCEQADEDDSVLTPGEPQHLYFTSRGSIADSRGRPPRASQVA